MTNTPVQKQDNRDKLIAAGVFVGATALFVVVGRRKINKKAVALAAQMSANAVQAWVDDHAQMGLSVILLPAKLTEQMFLDAAPAA